MNFDIEKNIMCVGDEKTLKQVFVILVDNAIKNSDKGAKITVRAFSESQRIIYKVHNTGAGIPKEELEKIFLRFYRSDSSRARRTGGYGLGLAIARAIAQDHGGTLVANSELGKWAEFTLTLPKRK
jgi:signal transduction histidine kinase